MRRSTYYPIHRWTNPGTTVHHNLVSVPAIFPKSFRQLQFDYVAIDHYYSNQEIIMIMEKDKKKGLGHRVTRSTLLGECQN